MLGGDAERGGMCGEGMRDERNYWSHLQLVREAVRYPRVDRGCCVLICQQGHVSR